LTLTIFEQTAFHASFKEEKADAAQTAVLAVSRGTSVILLLVYGLYLLFQLKTHAYMYESVPQAIIEAESHPGVLADMMDSSSSSDSSDSSSSSDSDSSGDSGSVKNARKRFKRMIKHRRHRKSSVSTASVSSPSASFPSFLSSAATTMERQDNSWEHAIGSPKISRRASALASVNNGKENLDADVEDGDNNTRVRDFGDTNGGDVSKALERKRSHKKSKKHQKRKDPVELSEKPPIESIEPVRSQSGPRVGFAEDISAAESQDLSAGKRPFNMRGFSRAPAFRPGLTKMLSNNVFATPPPPPSPSQTPVPTLRGRPMIRRTNSLPGRLNQLSVLAGVNPAPTVTRTGTDPIPPFQHQVGDEEAGVEAATPDGKLVMSRTAAVVMLLFSTALVAVCAEFLVEAIPEMVADSPVSEAFIGLIILPIVGNAAEHVTAVTVAAKNKMDLAIGVAVGSSIQIALFVTPVVVLLGWILNTEMSLYFNLFETISLFATVFVVNFLVLDGRSNYLEGTLLIAAYVIIAICAFYYPGDDSLSVVGGGDH
jgi:Ca2+:H+ antiporter